MNTNTINPVFEECNTAIVMACNNDFVKYASVLINSIIVNSSEHNYYDIVILYKNIGIDEQCRIISMIEKHQNFSIRFYKVNIDNEEELYVERNGSPLSFEAYYRLLICDILSEEYTRAVYLDVDMIVVEDVAQLYDINVDNYILGAGRDITGVCANYGPNGEARVRYQNEVLGIENTDEYFISATLVINLIRFREEISSEELVRMAKGRKWRQHDQDILNYLCRNKKAKLIDCSWNVMADFGKNKYLPDSIFDEWIESEKKPKIVHYGGNWKPWKMDTYRDKWFWENAVNTPFWQDIMIELLKSIDMVKIDVSNETLRSDILKLAEDIREGIVRARYSSIIEGLLSKKYFSDIPSTEIKLEIEIIRNHAKLVRETFSRRYWEKTYNDTRRRIGALKTQNNGLERKLKKMEKENKKLRMQYEKIINSMSFKIGKAITAFPRKVKTYNEKSRL